MATIIRRIAVAAVTAAAILSLSPGAAFAGPPTITRIDFSQFEAQAEGDWLAMCGFPVDVEFGGHIIVHEFVGNRLLEVDNWSVTMSYAANGKTFDLGHPIVGPDHVFIGRDGNLYTATSGRSVFQELIGHSVWLTATGELVSSHGRSVDNPFDDICAAVAP